MTIQELLLLQKMKRHVSVRDICKYLSISRSRYYKMLYDPESITVGEARKISELFELSDSQKRLFI